ncbi:Tannase [Dactylellina cionopaga]|nr:Tannase [Dactylellina cionopaga]
MKSLPLSALSALLLFSPSIVLAASHEFQTRCADLANSFEADNTSVLLAEYLAKGSTIANPDSCLASIVTRADLCRLKLNVTTSDTSSVIMEAWMPSNWKNKGKRYLMTGNSAMTSCILFYDLSYTSGLGFAAIGHNTGHEGSDVSVFANNEVFIDWAYRSGSSNQGRRGRQAVKVATDYSDQFDGIIAGASAIEYPAIAAAQALYYQITGPTDAPTYLDRDQWAVVEVAALAQCDKIDGVADSVLEDPFKCRFRPEVLICGPGQTWASNQCLTAAQVLTVRKLYQPIYGNNGRYILPEILPATDPRQGFLFVYGTPSQATTQDILRYVVFKDPTYDITTNFNLDTIDRMIDGPELAPLKTSPDLSALQASGSKLLMYHGLADPWVPPAGTIDYYEDVSRNMSLPSSDLDSFFRLFPISGLAHCAYGKGAGFVGGPAQVQYFPGAWDNVPARDGMLMKMVKWVEEGKAPETIRGWKLDATGHPIGTKDHCKYPLKTTFKGHGDPNKRGNWKCT